MVCVQYAALFLISLFFFPIRYRRKLIELPQGFVHLLTMVVVMVHEDYSSGLGVPSRVKVGISTLNSDTTSQHHKYCVNSRTIVQQTFHNLCKSACFTVVQIFRWQKNQPRLFADISLFSLCFLLQFNFCICLRCSKGWTHTGSYNGCD